jgi:hypothetical protein
LNGALEIFGETTGAFVVDERTGFRPAGLARIVRSRGEMQRAHLASWHDGRPTGQ